jgi:hypothetical protein
MSKKTVLLQLAKTLPNVPVEIEKLLEAERVKRVYDNRMSSVFEMPKEEPETVVDVEGTVVEGSEGDKGEPVAPPVGTPVSPPLPKEKFEIEKEVKTTTDKKLDAAEEQKKKDLKFLIALAKSQGKKVDEDAFGTMPIDEAITQLKTITKELI